jgi:phage-related minor tail protein
MFLEHNRDVAGKVYKFFGYELIPAASRVFAGNQSLQASARLSAMMVAGGAAWPGAFRQAAPAAGTAENLNRSFPAGQEVAGEETESTGSSTRECSSFEQIRIPHY